MSRTSPAFPDGVRRVRERRTEGGLPRFAVPEWDERFPWLVHGTTAGGAAELDLGLFGGATVGARLERWRRLRAELGLDRAVHAHQVHGRTVRAHDGAWPRGLLIADDADGHTTARVGVLLTVSVADCVPISLVDEGRRRIALLHGGWRGTAAGIVAAGLEALGGPADVIAHLGPAICGGCYEVGPEVHEALGLPVPAGPEPVDVRAVQARQLVEAGVPAARVTASTHCTLCGEGFFSHRGGSRGRQLGVLGIR